MTSKNGHPRRTGKVRRQPIYIGEQTALFQGETMTCVMCGRQEKSDPGRSSDWRSIELPPGPTYYACPAEFPADDAGSQEHTDAYEKIFRKIARLTGRPDELHDLSAKLCLLAAELERVQDARPLQLSMGPAQALMLLGQLQLVLRHPENSGLPAEFGRTVAVAIEAYLSRISPALAEIAAAGWEKNT